MSIVERALKKAQAQAQQPGTQSPSGEASAAAEELAESAGAAAVPEYVPDGYVVTEEFRAGEPVHAQRSIVLEIPRLKAEGMLAEGDDELRTTDEFRRLKWPILGAALGRGAPRTADNNLVLVTSSIPAEGKTFTSFNLALAIARERDTPVILVDSDVPNPRLTSLLGLSNAPGLTDLVADGRMRVEQVLCRTDLEGLYVLPAGRPDANSPELFASQRMDEVMRSLVLMVTDGVVVIDSPPVLATNEAQVLSRYVGQVLMVVRADFTEQRAVEEALALLDRSKPINCVLNAIDRSVMSMYYGDSYPGYGGYGKGSAYSAARR
jgi:exopolysaccharide/PEP-CTERM locus tyrosine autokinase